MIFDGPVPPERAETFRHLSRTFRRWAAASGAAVSSDDAAWAWKAGLVHLGSGSTRTVFGVPEGALKIPQTDADRAANLHEADVWRRVPARFRPALVPVLAVDPAGDWLLMERADNTRTGRPGVSAELLALCGISDLHDENVAGDGRILDYDLVDLDALLRCDDGYLERLPAASEPPPPARGGFPDADREATRLATCAAEARRAAHGGRMFSPQRDAEATALADASARVREGALAPPDVAAWLRDAILAAGWPAGPEAWWRWWEGPRDPGARTIPGPMPPPAAGGSVVASVLTPRALADAVARRLGRPVPVRVARGVARALRDAPLNRDRIVILRLGLGRDSMTMLALLGEGRLVVEGHARGPDEVDAVVFTDPGHEWEFTYDLIPRVQAFCDHHGLRFLVQRKPPAEGPNGWIAWIAHQTRTRQERRRTKDDPAAGGGTGPGDEDEGGETTSYGTPPWRRDSPPGVEARCASGHYHPRAPLFEDYGSKDAWIAKDDSSCTVNHKIVPNRELLADLQVERFGTLPEVAGSRKRLSWTRQAEAWSARTNPARVGREAELAALHARRRTLRRNVGAKAERAALDAEIVRVKSAVDLEDLAVPTGRPPHLMLIGYAADETERLAEVKPQKAGRLAFEAEAYPLMGMGIGKDDEQAHLDGLLGVAPDGTFRRGGFSDVKKSGCKACKEQDVAQFWLLRTLDPAFFRQIEAHERRVVARTGPWQAIFPRRLVAASARTGEENPLVAALRKEGHTVATREENGRAWAYPFVPLGERVQTWLDAYVRENGRTPDAEEVARKEYRACASAPKLAKPAAPVKVEKPTPAESSKRSRPVTIRLGLPLPSGALAVAAQLLATEEDPYTPVLISANSMWDKENGRFVVPGREYMVVDLKKRRDGVQLRRKARLSVLDGLDVALDSAGFVAMTVHGGTYPWTIQQYVELAYSYGWTWWSSMDFCCEPQIADDPAEVERRVYETAANLLRTFGLVDHYRSTFTSVTPEEAARIYTDPMPILQGWTADDYAKSAAWTQEALDHAGRPWPAMIGVGSVCRRQLAGSAGLHAILGRLDTLLPAHVGLHLFGVKGQILGKLADHPRVVSVDSQAWGDAARRRAKREERPADIGLKVEEMRRWLAVQRARCGCECPPEGCAT